MSGPIVNAVSQILAEPAVSDRKRARRIVDTMLRLAERSIAAEATALQTDAGWLVWRSCLASLRREELANNQAARL